MGHKKQAVGGAAELVGNELEVESGRRCTYDARAQHDDT